MKYVLTSDEIRHADKEMFVSLGITEVELMSLAGKACYDAFVRTYGICTRKRVLIVCGKGSNGGDGFVLARHLINHGAIVDVLSLYPVEKINSASKHALSSLMPYLTRTDTLNILEIFDSIPSAISHKSYDFVVDAILGTGFMGAQLKEMETKAVSLINTFIAKCPIISIDVPTGLNSTTGAVVEPTVRADMTISLAYLKVGLISNDIYTGHISVVDISIPSFFVSESSWQMLDFTDVKKMLPKRNSKSYKSHNGKVLIVGGSRSSKSSMVGAALLASQGAVASGAGYVVVAVPPESFNAVHARLPYVVVCDQSIDTIMKKMEWADSILFGCGLGQSQSSQEIIKEVVKSQVLQDKKVIFDADAITTIGKHSLLSFLESKQCLITPHEQEFKNVFFSKEFQSRYDKVRTFYKATSVSILLKGAPTLIASHDRFYLNNTGTEALATAGTGDVLSGIIVGLAAQGLSLADASASGAFIHGLAGRLAQEKLDFPPSSMDVLNAFGDIKLE